MRKIIETASTLVLWTIFIVGSSFAIADLVLKTENSELIMAHLSLISLAPLFAALIFAAMLVSVRFSKFQLMKKTIASEHAIQWSTEELTHAQSGKMVDLHFPGTGLACHVVTRDDAAAVLHSEKTTVHLKVVPQTSDDSVGALLPQAAYK